MHDYRPPIYSRAITLIAFIFAFVAATSFTSALTVVYMGLYLFMMLLMAVSCKRIHTIILMYHYLTLHC